MSRRILTVIVLVMLTWPAGLCVGTQTDAGEMINLRDPVRIADRGNELPAGPKTYQAVRGPREAGPGSTIAVTTFDDELNGDGDCSLREAIQAANTDGPVDACTPGSGSDTILVPSGTYILTIPGANEDGNQTGDLDIRGDLVIQGEGASSTIVDGDGLDRVFDIFSGLELEFSDITATHGYVYNSVGAGVWNWDSDITLNRVVLAENTVVTGGSGVGGGGLFNSAYYGDASATLNDCLVIDNVGYWQGGIGQAAYTDVRATLVLNDTTVTGNVSESGGGIGSYKYVGAVDPKADVQLNNSTVSYNIASTEEPQSGLGGGIEAWDGEVWLINTTVSGNYSSGTGIGDASGLGGGIALVSSASPTTMSLLNSTVTENSSTVGGGGIVTGSYAYTVDITFKNSLVAGNSAPPGLGENCFTYFAGAFNSLGHNLEDYDTCEFDEPTDWPNTDPLLGPLQYNGGPTKTHALLEGSLARDHGDDDACPPTDQRGVTRPQGPHCDISAFEADETPPAVTAVSPPDGETEVPLDATVVITFSEPISVPTFAYGVSPDPGGWLEDWGSNDTVVTLTHDVFAYGTVYNASVTAAEDVAGNPMASPYEWSFTTIMVRIYLPVVLRNSG